MRRLILCRHAKSDWTPGTSDHDRVLSPRGIAAAPRMAQWLKTEYGVPDLVICSTAVRTRETLDLLAEAWGETPVSVYERAMYLGSDDRMLRLVHGFGGDAETVMLVGHNPGMGDLTLALVETADAADASGRMGKFPTAAIAVLEFAVDDWSNVVPESGTLVAFQKPRLLV